MVNQVLWRDCDVLFIVLDLDLIMFVINISYLCIHKIILNPYLTGKF